MIAGVADTHTALWYLYDDGRLSVAAGDFIDQAAAAGRQIVVSSISLAEILYLIEKNRLSANAYADSDHVFKEAPFTVEIVDAMRQIPRADVPDMPDRVVAATGVYTGHQPRRPPSGRPTCKRSGSPLPLDRIPPDLLLSVDSWASLAL
jgi:PIN domain nuclease of toxin-antitoxin system